MKALDHQVLFYTGVNDFLTATVPYLESGLAGDDHVLVVVPEPRLSALRDSLGSTGRHVQFADARLWYEHPVRTIRDYADVVRRHAPRHVRAVAEPVWQGRDRLEVLEWNRYESIVNAAFADAPVSVICPYDTGTVPSQVIEQARRTHPGVIEGWAAYANDEYVEPAEFAADCDRGPLPPVPPGAGYLPIEAEADLRGIRVFTERQAVAHGLTGKEKSGFITACNEVATNAVRHGVPPAGIWIWPEDETLICQVADHGYWRPGGLAGLLPPSSAAQHGFGLWAVRLMVDHVQVRAGWEGTYVRLHARRRSLG